MDVKKNQRGRRLGINKKEEKKVTMRRQKKATTRERKAICAVGRLERWSLMNPCTLSDAREAQTNDVRVKPHIVKVGWSAE